MIKSFWQKTIESGFSLLEIVVTLSLLAVSLVAIITVAVKMLQVEHITENDFIAKGLLIEAVELAEAKRNANVAASSPFYLGLATSTTNGSTSSFAIDYTGATTTVGALPDANAQLKYNDTYFYQAATGTASKFYRRIVSTYRTANKGSLEIEAQVYWADRGGKGNTQKLSTVLYNNVY
jgi:prepilin-type N-terminal cleavage/methylation domain-containing protein